MKQHMWVAIQYSPVDVELNQDTGVLTIHTTEMGDELARDEAQLGCWICEQPLNIDTYNTECPGSPPEN